MKHIFTLIALLIFKTGFCQVQELGALSAGRFIDSAVIMEEDESDVFGYCLLYELDRKSKEVFDLEYVILDKNLNKLTSIDLTQAIFKTWTARTMAQITFVKKIGGELIIGVNDRLKNINQSDLMPFFNFRFVNLNLDDFTFSAEYKYEGFAKKNVSYTAGDVLEYGDIWNLQKIITTKSDKFLVFASPEYNPKVGVGTSVLGFDMKRSKSVGRFAVLNKDMEIVWSKDINTVKKTACRYGYLNSDEDVLLLKKEIIKNEEYTVQSIEAYNINTGDFIGEIKLDDPDYQTMFFSLLLDKDKMHLFVNAYEKSKKGRDLGYIHYVIDKKSALQTQREPFFWKNMAEGIPGMNEFSKVGKEDYVVAQDFILTPNQKILMVAEAFHTEGGQFSFSVEPKTFAVLKNMYLLEFDNGLLGFHKTIEKSNSVQIPQGMYSEQLRKYGVFDYNFCQKISKTGDFIFYYTLNDQEGNRRKLAKNPLWTLGIVSNVGGEYGFDTLPLYGDDLKIYPGIAKNGYIRLLEVNQKTGSAELRLEKINY